MSYRIGEILESSEINQWRWVPTLENVADDGTRDFKKAEISSDSRWLNGPEFLRFPEKDWPVEKTKNQPVEPCCDEL